MESNNLLSECQHSFVAGISCTTNFLEVLDRWTELLDSGTSVEGIYLDFAKAFDSAPYQRLLLKLQFYGVGSHMLAWIIYLFVGRCQRMCMNGSYLRLGRCHQRCSSR